MNAPQSNRAAWDKIAPGYDRTNTPTQMWLGNEGLVRAGLHQGMRFLDVAAGSGALSIPAARIGAQVLATDQSPIMLELLNQRARKEGLGIETRVMDGRALELDTNSFDMAGSQFGVMLFPDMPKGISEMVRVVKHGRPRADECVWRSAQNRILRLLRERDPDCSPRFQRTAYGSSSASLSATRARATAQGIGCCGPEGDQDRDYH